MELEITDLSDFRILTGAAKTHKTNKTHKTHKTDKHKKSMNNKSELRDIELYYRVFLLCKWYK